MKGIKLGLACLAMLLVGCSKAKDDKTDDDLFFRYYNLEKKGWKSKIYTQKIDDISFTATEVPIQYYVLKDLGKDQLKAADSIYEHNKRERVVEVTFRQDDEQDLLSEKFTHLGYDDALKYMSFAIDKDFYVVTSKKDTIRCEGVNYERSYRIAPFQRIVLFFSGIDPEDTIQLIYEDHLYRKGTLKFKFENTQEILL